MLIRRLLLPLIVVVLAALTVPSALAGPSDTYGQAHFGDGNVPAGCIVDRDPINPDNLCYHMKVGLNALDSPKVDVDVLLPVSPAAERDMRIATQAVQMWDDGLHYLADQMDLDWLNQGFEMNVRTHLVGVDAEGLPIDPIALIDPEIVVVVSNPAGGIGIGIDPTSFIGQLGLVDDNGVPCAALPNPFSMKQWQANPKFKQHGGEPGGTYVQDCGGVGGNVCLAINGAVDPVPGLSDFFPLFDLVSHEFGHCLTLGHVGDGADGPWGPTPTNDIMAYSTDPPLVNKCVSTLDVEGFALRMSHYLDVSGDGKVTKADELIPNDVKGDGANSFQIQHPDDHWYASSTGAPGDCPQPDLSLAPGSEADFYPTAKSTTRPKLKLGKVTTKAGMLSVNGVAEHVSKVKPPTRTSGSVTDGSSDGTTPVDRHQGPHGHDLAHRDRRHHQGRQGVAGPVRHLSRGVQPDDQRTSTRLVHPDRWARRQAGGPGQRHRLLPAAGHGAVGRGQGHGHLPRPPRLPRRPADQGAVQRLRRHRAARPHQRLGEDARRGAGRAEPEPGRAEARQGDPGRAEGDEEVHEDLPGRRPARSRPPTRPSGSAAWSARSTTRTTGPSRSTCSRRSWSP